MLHSAPQLTFLADNKELLHCITFPPLWPNLAPCSAFSQHTSIIFRTILLWLDSAENLSTLTRWKSSDWTISAVPGCFEPSECLRGGSGGLIWVWQARTGMHTNTQVLCGEKWAANYGVAVTGSGCGEVTVPPGELTSSRHVQRRGWDRHDTSERKTKALGKR